ncbi:MAG: hypothetical protein OEN22_07495 [Gammaproteobacteria bacterium]|nr:hypothetical protein [Gammaproteobacteria bacterium]
MIVTLMRGAGIYTTVLLSVLALLHEVAAHEVSNYSEFTIDAVNDNALGRSLEIQGLMSEVIRGRIGGDEWPVTEFRELRDSLTTIKEEVDEILAHYVFDGVEIQVALELRAEPRIGRTAAASGALKAGIALIDQAASLASADEFITEFYAGGMAARLYELLEAHVDRMELYAVLADYKAQ